MPSTYGGEINTPILDRVSPPQASSSARACARHGVLVVGEEMKGLMPNGLTDGPRTNTDNGGNSPEMSGAAVSTVICRSNRRAPGSPTPRLSDFWRPIAATGARLKLCQAQAVGRLPAETYSLPILSFPLQPLRPHDAHTRANSPVLHASIGGFVVQEITLAEPKLVRRLILLGTGLRTGVGMDGGTPEGNRIFGATYAEPDHLWLSVFFTPSQASQAAGRAFLKRFRLRAKDRDPEVNDKVAPAHRAAIAKWAAPRERSYDYLKAIQQPTLVVNGSNDVIIYTMNSFILQQNLPNAQLIIYPDSAHGSHHQYPELFVRHASMFLSGDEGREHLSLENGRPFATSGNREYDHAQPHR
jgi:hypothetical protein